MTIELTEEQRQFVEAEVAAGHFAGHNEVLQAAVELLASSKRDGDLEHLRALIDEGDAGGLYAGDIFTDLRRKFRLLSQIA